ncbi:MAG: glycosyltransferase family 4 protein [Desulfobacterales bacterium]|nr:glycosyltransferase family 4 protein [Desulfobacterales bacterium]
MRSLYKIIHTTCHTGWAGLEKRIFNESLWMRERGHEVIIVAPEDTPLYTRAKEADFKVYPIAFTRLSLFKDYGRLKALFKKEAPHILNTHGNTDGKVALLAAKKARIPCRIFSRHISAHVKNSWLNRLIYKKWSHYTFTTAGYTTRHLTRVFGLKHNQVFSMPSGIIPPETLMDKDGARKALAKELDLEEKTRFIGFAGRISRDKGVDILVKAFARIQRRIPHHLAIVGDGTEAYMEELKEWVQSKGLAERVHFVGFRENVWDFYRALDCKILASRNKNGIPFEGVPQALLEAMYCSCPVVGAQSGGIGDIIEDQVTGLIFPVEDHETLSQHICDTIENPARTLERVHTARKRVQKSHTMDAMGRDTIRIYRLHEVWLEQQRMGRLNSIF